MNNNSCHYATKQTVSLNNESNPGAVVFDGAHTAPTSNSGGSTSTIVPDSHIPSWSQNITPRHFLQWTWRRWPRSTQSTPPLYPTPPPPLSLTFLPNPLDWNSPTPHIHWEISISPPDPSAPTPPQKREKRKTII